MRFSFWLKGLLTQTADAVGWTIKSGAQSMNRSLATCVAALLVGYSLAGCSTTTGPKTAASAAATATKPNTSAASMAASMDTQIRDAQNLRAKGDYAGATQILSQLMLVAPDNSRVVGEYGKNLVLQGRSKESLDFLKRGVQLQPGDWTLYSATGVAYDQMGDYANAKLAYQQALAIKPGDAGVLNNFALSRMQAKDLSGARQLMTQASATGGSDPKIARNIALLTSLEPTPPIAPATAKPAPAQQQAAAKPATDRQAPPKSLGPNVVVQQVPKDPLAGPVKQAASAPHKPAQDTAEAKQPAAAATTTKTADAAPHKLVPDTSEAKKPAAAALRTTDTAAIGKPVAADAKKPVAVPTATKTADTTTGKPVAAGMRRQPARRLHLLRPTSTKTADAAASKSTVTDTKKPAVTTATKTADAAPHKLIPDTSDVKKPTAAAPKAADTATGKPAQVATDAKKPAPKAADAASAKPAPASNPPTLRMTADAATP